MPPENVHDLDALQHELVHHELDVFFVEFTFSELGIAYSVLPVDMLLSWFPAAFVFSYC
jgi:hypothetical protein